VTKYGGVVSALNVIMYICRLLCFSERDGCGEKVFELSCVYTYNFKKDFIIKYLTTPLMLLLYRTRRMNVSYTVFCR
jgi:hypothetical protein